MFELKVEYLLLTNKFLICTLSLLELSLPARQQAGRLLLYL